MTFGFTQVMKLLIMFYKVEIAASALLVLDSTLGHTAPVCIKQQGYDFRFEEDKSNST